MWKTSRLCSNMWRAWKSSLSSLQQVKAGHTENQWFLLDPVENWSGRETPPTPLQFWTDRWTQRLPAEVCYLEAHTGRTLSGNLVGCWRLCVTSVSVRDPFGLQLGGRCSHAPMGSPPGASPGCRGEVLRKIPSQLWWRRGVSTTKCAQSGFTTIFSLGEKIVRDLPQQVEENSSHSKPTNLLSHLIEKNK